MTISIFSNYAHVATRVSNSFSVSLSSCLQFVERISNFSCRKIEFSYVIL